MVAGANATVFLHALALLEVRKQRALPRVRRAAAPPASRVMYYRARRGVMWTTLRFRTRGACRYVRRRGTSAMSYS